MQLVRPAFILLLSAAIATGCAGRSSEQQQQQGQEPTPAPP
ncbi:MAG: hypothetical protein K0R28_3446, partial [Paenibacillus sp.]|nr:hypothetical protein [Paenibacillus sp.]